MVQIEYSFNDKSVDKEGLIHKEPEELILIDSLTKLPNYYYFQDEFNRKWKSAVRKQEPISLAVFDLDHLQYFNELYGTHEGDRILRKVGEEVQGLLDRPEDFLARYEGGKFALILPETNINTALKIVESIRQGIETMKIPHPKSTTSEFVTISFGVGTKSPFIWEDPVQFVKAVEQAMYKAKRIGRNQVIWSNVFIEESLDM